MVMLQLFVNELLNSGLTFVACELGNVVEYSLKWLV